MTFHCTQMLEEMGFVMQESQFQEFLKLVNCDKNGLTYSDFIASFEDPRDNGMGQVARSLNSNLSTYLKSMIYFFGQKCKASIKTT